MGADAFADDKGEFVIEVRAWRTENCTFPPQQQIVFTGLEPRQKIDIEILKGEWR